MRSENKTTINSNQCLNNNKDMFTNQSIITLSLLMLLVVAEVKAILPEGETSQWINSLNGNWKFKFEKETFTVSPHAVFNGDVALDKWHNITVPSNWEMENFGRLRYKTPSHDEVGWYYREFQTPDSWRESARKIHLYFEGVAYGFEVWINGKRVGDFESAFNRSEFSIDQFINKKGTNRILVKVYSNHEHVAFDASDSWALHGIFRDVYLYAVPQVHFDKIVITTPLEDNKANINIKVDIHSFNFKGLPLKGLKVEALLKFNGQLITSIKEPVLWESKYHMPKPLNISLTIEQAQLWNAETPHLYDLELSLKHNERDYHHINQKVGIREISIEGKQLLLNDSPIKIRGINRHEMHPERGRAVTINDMKLDLELMKQANINTIRCSHYPPHPKFIDLCDEYGFYVINEVPICFNEYAQKIPGNLGVMLERVYHTIMRDINHPSIIIWSVGNENPISTNWIKTYEYCKMLDTTRPALYSGNNFHGFLYGMPANTDIFADHYPNTNEVKEHRDDKNIKTPIIYTEYNHALDKALYDLEERWNIMQNSPKHMGGCIWDWVDQELLRTIPKGAKIIDTKGEENPYPINKNDFVANKWLTNSTILDCHAAYGNDGIVDGYRNPSASYYEVQAVYSPIKLLTKKVKLNINEAPNIQIQNHYDFIDLSKHKFTWKWYSNNKLVEQGTLLFNALAHTKESIELPFNLNESLANNVNLIELSVVDHQQRNIFNRTIEVITNSDCINNTKYSKHRDDYEPIPIQSEIKINTNQKLIFKKNSKFQFIHNSEVVAEGPILKTGRKADNTIKWLSYYNKIKNRKELPVFYSEIINESYRIKNAQWTRNDSTTHIKLLYAFQLKNVTEDVMLTLDIFVNKSGIVDFEYQIVENPSNIHFLELGFGLRIPKNLNKIGWIGNGPYPQYPKKESAGIFNYHTMMITDVNFEGNHSGIDALLIHNSKKYGICLLSDDQNWVFNTYKNSYILSNMVFVGDRPKKGALPKLIKLNDTHNNNFSFFLFERGNVSQCLKGLL